MLFVHFPATEDCHINFKLLEVFSQGCEKEAFPLNFQQLGT